MHDFATDFETVTPDLWSTDEETWKERLLKLPKWCQVGKTPKTTIPNSRPGMTLI